MLLVTIEMIVVTMESYDDASNPWIRAFTRIDPPAPRDGHCAGPYLVGCRAHARICEVTLYDCGRAIGGAHRLAGCRPVSRLSKYLSRNHREPPAVPTILFGLLIPLAVAAIALWRSESIARLVSAIPLQWLV